MLRIKMILNFLILFNQILTFGIKLQIMEETHMLSKCKLNSLNSLEYYVVPKAKNWFSKMVKIWRHKHVLFLGHQYHLYKLDYNLDRNCLMLANYRLAAQCYHKPTINSMLDGWTDSVQHKI